ncbi:MAG: FG-GAP-like repeat-containing protein [Planctomycetota bacterium]|nr:FG-GAP-like repeat-containing protein [Planctomycetota bacterium]
MFEHRLAVSLIVVGVCLACALPCPAQTFGAPTAYNPGGTEPISLFIADFDGANGVDIAVANFTTNNIGIFLNAGGGVFPGAATNYALPGGATGPIDICGGDLEPDGDVDLVTSNSTTNNVTVFLNAGGGVFGAGVSYATGATGLNVLYVGNLDTANGLDIAVADFGGAAGDNVYVLLEQVAAGISYGAAAAYPVGAGGADAPFGLAGGLIDGDADIDLVCSCAAGDQMAYMANNGVGVFAVNNLNIAAGGSGPSAIVVANFNGGGLDAATVNQLTDNISIALGDGATPFPGPWPSPVYAVSASAPGPFQLASADLDGDGDIDIAVATPAVAGIDVRVNNGAGVFAAAAGSPFTTGPGTDPRGIKCADVDGDGDQDLIAGELGTDRVVILLNTTGGGGGGGGAGGGEVTGGGSGGGGCFVDGADRLARRGGTGFVVLLVLIVSILQVAWIRKPKKMCP